MISILSNLVRGVSHKVRYKLLILVLLPIFLMMPVGLVLAVYWGKDLTYKQLFLKVNTDLAVSHDAFARLRQDYLNQLSYFAESYAFRVALKEGKEQDVLKQVEALKDKVGYSFLKVIPVHGNIDALALKQYRASSSLSKALKGEASVGIEIYSADELQQISPDVHLIAQLPLLSTPRAQHSSRILEDRAMVIRALYPVKNSKGTVLALIEGGVLLNKNFEFVDTIRDLAYSSGSLPKGSFGTVTVFLDDVRISTNVPLKKGERALGTRVSEEVRNKVLGHGKVWIDRAFVVNDWYVSSYEPIIDIDGNRVGMLYAGFLEKPFRDAFWQALAVLVLLFLGLMAVSAGIAIKGAKSIFKPIERMSDVVKATQQGNEVRVGLVDSQDELGTLSNEFDEMLDKLQCRNNFIQKWADSLEDKVALRTVELKNKNQDLENSIALLRQTRQQLVVSEKLAALGELTAGVAHEINNPAAVILGNLDLMVDELGDNADPIKDEIELVIEQIYRIKDIINTLLQYAHPEEYSDYVCDIDVNTLLNDTLYLIKHLNNEKQFDIDCTLEASLTLQNNPQELQQVFINLLVNAVHALPASQGHITIKSSNWAEKGVVVSIADNGQGIKQEYLAQVFTPFFSTKAAGEGTGLGLSISYTMVRRYGGHITVKSVVGEGAEFSVWLLTEPKIVDDKEIIAEEFLMME